MTLRGGRARGIADPGRFAVFCQPDGAVRKLLTLTRADALLDVHADRDAALAAVAS